jgi:hypothetical protein
MRRIELWPLSPGVARVGMGPILRIGKNQKASNSGSPEILACHEAGHHGNSAQGAGVGRLIGGPLRQAELRLFVRRGRLPLPGSSTVEVLVHGQKLYRHATNVCRSCAIKDNAPRARSAMTDLSAGAGLVLDDQAL